MVFSFSLFLVYFINYLSFCEMSVLAIFLIVLVFTQSGIDLRDYFTSVKPKAYEVVLKVDTTDISHRKRN